MLLAQRPDLVERFASLLRDIVDVGGKKRGGFGERNEVATRGGDSTLPGDEFNAPSLAYLFSFAKQDAGDLSGMGYMRAATGREIEIADVDEAKFVPLRRREFAQAKLPRLLLASRNGYRQDDSQE